MGSGVDEFGVWAEVEVAGVPYRLRRIPAGRYTVGSPDDEPGRRADEEQREVELGGYWIGETAVTQAHWKAVMGGNPSRFQGAERPVEQVSWEDAQAFVAKVNKQQSGLELALPSDAEWEVACRAGTTTPFAVGNDVTSDVANFDGEHPYLGTAKLTFRQETVAVGSLPANAWGLREMHGNVWEWCQDAAEWSRESGGRLVKRGSERVLRGGSWYSHARYCRSACRSARPPSNGFPDVGFRLFRRQVPEERPLPSFSIATDRGHWRVTSHTKPDWAESIGRDPCGLWAAARIADVSVRLRWIPPGPFWMGSPESEPGRWDDETLHEVVLTRGHWLAETPCTQELWQAVTGANPSRFRTPDRPVEQVSWDDAQAFLERSELPAGKDGLQWCLPTEAQWERACRAGTTTSTYAGDVAIEGENHAPRLSPIAWYGGNSGVQAGEVEEPWDSSGWPEKEREHELAASHPVARKARNRFGLYDMLGNVLEWCADATDLDAYPASMAVNPLGTDGSERVLRGGSWYASARDCRSAYRGADPPSRRSPDVGFRLSRGQVPDPGRVRPGSEPSAARSREGRASDAAERARRKSASSEET